MATQPPRSTPPTLVAAGLLLVLAFSAGLAFLLFEQLYADRIYPGVAEGLTLLKRSSLRLACVTNKAQRFTAPLLERMNLAGYFDAVVCGVFQKGAPWHDSTFYIPLAAAQRKPDRVVIVDLDLQFGQVATHLNVQPRQTLTDVVRDEAGLREPELLRTYATRHDSGLHVLAGPTGPEAAQLITADHVDRILTTLLDTYDQIVIDTGSWLDERTLRAFDHAESVILVLNPEIAALKAITALVEYLGEAGTVAGKTTFVLNNTFGREILKLRDVEQALGTTVGADLPYDPFLYLKAVNEGVPIVLGAPKSPAADRLVKLSKSAFGADGLVVPPGAEERKSGGRFSLRRR